MTERWRKRKQAQHGLIKEGVGTVLSAEYPAEGGSGGI